jgi:hypothetical protein
VTSRLKVSETWSPNGGFLQEKASLALLRSMISYSGLKGADLMVSPVLSRPQ